MLVSRHRRLGYSLWLGLAAAAWAAGPALAFQEPAVRTARTSPRLAPDTPAQPLAGAPGRVVAAVANDPVAAPAAPPTDAPATTLRTRAPTVEAGPADERGLPPGETPSAPAPDSAAPAPEAPADQPLDPVPDPQFGGPVAIDPASFNGATPGVTTMEKLQATWGKPKQAAKQGALDVHLYAVEPFDRVEVAFAEDKVASIVIRLQQPFPAKHVAEQLELARVQPVLISNELGEILGQAYPERGVIFGFEPAKEPGKTTMQVVQIVLEPVGPEPFLLRAETNLDTRPEQSLADLDQVLKLSPANARAHWLRARLLAAAGQTHKALEAAAEATRLDPGNPHYHTTRAQVLGQAGQYAEAVAAATRALETSERRPHVKARALCLLGDLAAAGPKRDYKQALDYHTEAIKTADPLAASPHPAIRLAAKDVLVDAHLGAACDIAWGVFKQKETAVPKWIGRAAAFADEIIANDGGGEEYRFRIAARALAACAGAQGKLDPAEWAAKAVETGERLIAAAQEPGHKQQAAWNLGMALYDALQTCQLRSDNQKALQYGEMAVRYLEQGGAARQQTLAYSYLLGRVYFRLGAIHAVGEQNHRAAVTWFDKATPLLSKPVPEEALADLARHGETFVSMAVSYWEVGQREKALDLTNRGAALMEKAVEDGTADRSILAVPYGNLATMHQALGQQTQARQFAEMAAQNKGTVQR